MGSDSLPGYLPPGTVPFDKCWKETSPVSFCCLHYYSTWAAVMLLWTPPYFINPLLEHKKPRGKSGHLVCSLNKSGRSGASLILDAILPSKMRFGHPFLEIWGHLTSRRKRSIVEPRPNPHMKRRQKPLQQTALLYTESRSESWWAGFRQIFMTSLDEGAATVKT